MFNIAPSRRLEHISEQRRHICRPANFGRAVFLLLTLLLFMPLGASQADAEPGISQTI
jgi:hypothetical protein